MRYCSLRPSQHALWKMSTVGTAEVKTKVQNWLGLEGAMLFLVVFLNVIQLSDSVILPNSVQTD